MRGVPAAAGQCAPRRPAVPSADVSAETRGGAVAVLAARRGRSRGCRRVGRFRRNAGLRCGRVAGAGPVVRASGPTCTITW